MRSKTIPYAVLCVVTFSTFTWLRGAAALDAEATMPRDVTAPDGVVRVVGADHPVGIPLTRFSGAGGGGRDDIPGLNRAVINGEQVWWIDMEEVPNGERDATDLILFTRRDGGRPLPYIECETCHDPATGDDSALRTSNGGSRLCRACHPY